MIFVHQFENCVHVYTILNKLLISVITAQSVVNLKAIWCFKQCADDTEQFWHLPTQKYLNKGKKKGLPCNSYTKTITYDYNFELFYSI